MISCNSYILGLPRICSTYLFAPFYINPKASITGGVVVLRCHVLLIYISRYLNLLRFTNVFKDVFLSAGTAASIKRQVFSICFFFFSVIPGRFEWISLILICFLSSSRWVSLCYSVLHFYTTHFNPYSSRNGGIE